MELLFSDNDEVFSRDCDLEQALLSAWEEEVRDTYTVYEAQIDCHGEIQHVRPRTFRQLRELEDFDIENFAEELTGHQNNEQR